MLLDWHIAETREKAREEAKHGLMRWHNEYIHGTLQRPGSVAFKSPEAAVEERRSSQGSAAVIGTPDDLVKMIKGVLRQERRVRHLRRLRARLGQSREHLPQLGPGRPLRHPRDQRLRDQAARIGEVPPENRAVFDRAGQAIMAKIMENKDAAEALKVTSNPRVAAANAALPKGLKEKEEQEKKGKHRRRSSLFRRRPPAGSCGARTSRSAS